MFIYVFSVLVCFYDKVVLVFMCSRCRCFCSYIQFLHVYVFYVVFATLHALGLF